MKEIGAYIHIPFCKRKCKYCDFVSFENTEFIEEYVNCLIKNIEDIDEILYENKIGKLEDVMLDTVYFGGGTPSFIPSKYIVKILDKLKEKFKIKENAEITIEVNPGTVDKEKLNDYLKNGINRLSIGLQSANDEILKVIGRIHKFDEFLNTYNLARETGFKNINVDLMEALPNQSLQDLEDSLNKIILLNPEHISLYSLILEEGTALEKEVNDGTLKLPSEDLERKMYHETKKILEENGYIHYEISNFAKENFYSYHNMNCWNQHEYLGFGLASHSYFNNKRFSIDENLKKYIDKINKKSYNEIVQINEIQSTQDKMKEYVLLGFRKIDGIDLEEFKKKFNVDMKIKFKQEILELENKGLIDVNSNKICLSKIGLDFANLVFEKFV